MAGSDGMRLGARLFIVAFVGVVGTGVAFGLRSASGARPVATRESGRFRAAFVDPFFVEAECVEEERGLLCPSACVSGGERRGIMWVRAKRLSEKSASVIRIRKVEVNQALASCIPAADTSMSSRTSTGAGDGAGDQVRVRYPTLTRSGA